MFLILRRVFLLKLTVLVSMFTLAGLSNTAQAETKQVSSLDIGLNVYKDPNCGCCNDWIDHANERGFKVKSHNSNRMHELKMAKGIRAQYQSCHTAISAEGYVFEGHVPARYVQQFLSAPPANAIGLSVPAMPMGSPGMEYQNRFDPYKVLLLMKDGSSQVYANITNLEDSVK